MSDTLIPCATPSLIQWLLKRGDHICSDPEAPGGVVHAIEKWPVATTLNEPGYSDDEDPLEAPRWATVCGEEATVLWSLDEENARLWPYGWPVRVSCLRQGVTRCPSCHDLTGRQRPHRDWPAL